METASEGWNVRGPRIVRFALLGGVLVWLLGCGGGTPGEPSGDPTGASPSVDETEEEEATDEPASELESFAETYIEWVDNLNYATADSLAVLDDAESDGQAIYDALIDLANQYEYAAEDLGIYVFPEEVEGDVDELRSELIGLMFRFERAANDDSTDLEALVASLSVLSEIGGRLRETAGLPPPSNPNSP